MTTTASTGSASRALRAPGRLLTVLGAAAVAAAVALVILAIDGSLGGAAPGLIDAGPEVRWAIPALRAAYDVCACLTIGLLVVTTFVLAPERGTDEAELHGTRMRAVRLAATAATGWLATGVALLVLTYADIAGKRPGTAGFLSELNFYVREIDLGRSAFISLILVLLVATCAGGVTRIAPTAWLTVLSLVALFPVALSGHAAGTDDHQNAVDSLLVHLVGVTVWVGGLLALLVLFTTRGEPDRELAPAARRYSSIAVWCFVAVALSGVLNAWLRLGGLDNLGTSYGVLVLAKTALLVVLGGFGWRQRTKLLVRLDDGTTGAQGRATFLRFALVETAVMAGTLGVAVALSRTPTPAAEAGTVGDPIAALLGFPMPSPQTGYLLLTSWYTDWLWLGIAVVLAALYVAAVLRLRRRGDRWSPGRTVAWLLGCACLVFATNGGPAVYSRVNFSGHMLQHMTLMMLVPIFLVLAAPITLALRALRKRQDGSRGPREWLLSALHSRFVRVVSNPIVAAVLFIGSLVGFYYTGLFQLSLATHTGHILMTVHFLLVGYLFVWVLIGVDPGPPRPPYPLRLVLLLATISFHAFFGLALMTGDSVLAPDWWASINLTDQAELVRDQHVGGGIAWGVGELPTLILIVVLGIMWARDDDREARRKDRQADRDGDAELTAWNAQFTRLAEQDDRRRPPS